MHRWYSRDYKSGSWYSMIATSRHLLNNDRRVLADPSAKREYNRRLFTVVAPRYFTATRLMSFFRDRAWKRFLVSSLPDRTDGFVLDIATGTGDLAVLAKQRWPDSLVAGCDVSLAMMTVIRQPRSRTALRQICQDMAALGFVSESAGIITGGYALRNAPEVAVTLREVNRVLKPGGSAAFLDFSRSPVRVLFFFQYWILRLWGGFWGFLLHGNPSVYAYIAESLRLFPDRNRLYQMMVDAGFCDIVFVRRMAGMVDIIVARKPAGPQ
jgi:ubiquinone/menaquinone biosynthesis methyltransferase